MSENARGQAWDEEPAYLDWEALKTGLPPGGQSGQVLVFDAPSGDWKWAPRPDASLAADNIPPSYSEDAPPPVMIGDGGRRWYPLAAEQGDLKGSVADFLRAGLRNIDADMVNPENRDNLWRQGYHAASKHLARDLCRHLDIAWDDKTHEPAKGA